jgi:hypothetical protein
MSRDRKSLMESHEAKRLLPEVRKILRDDWDPIPGSPNDEYDSYAGAVVRLLLAKADATQIADHIRRVAGPALAVPEDQLAQVAQKLAALRPDSG